MKADYKSFWNKAKSFLTSMRFFILLVMILLVATPVVTFDVAFVGKYKTGILQQKEEEVQKETQKLSLKITSWIKEKKFNISDEEKRVSYNEDELLKSSSTIFDTVMVVDKNYKVVADNLRYARDSYIISKSAKKSLVGKEVVDTSEYQKKITTFIPIANEKQGDKIEGVLITTYPIDTTLKNIDVVSSSARTVEIIILLISVVIAYIMSIFLTRPNKKILMQISDLSNGLSNEMDVRTFYETRQITEAFNRMLKKQLKEDEVRQEFVSNVSHELRTPITSMKVLAESLLSQEYVENEIYREFMEDIAAEVDREDRIITDLLSLVRIEKAEVEPTVEICSINKILEVVLKRIYPIAEKKGIEIKCEEFTEVDACVDEVKLSLAFSNLIENAIKYNKKGGWVKLYLNSDTDYFYFKVSDNGIGISEAEQENIFDRFYRVDKSRTAATGGTGLGLSITRNVIIRHRGVIKVYSDGENGTIFTIRVPLNLKKV